VPAARPDLRSLTELQAVALLLEGEALIPASPLVAGEDPPDVALVLTDGRRIGIEVGRPIDSVTAQTGARLQEVREEVANMLADLAPAFVKVQCVGGITHLAAATKAERSAFSRQLADAVRALAAVAPVGMKAVACSGYDADDLIADLDPDPTRVVRTDVQRPMGVQWIWFERDLSRSDVYVAFDQHRTQFGPGLHQAAEIVARKSDDVLRWPAGYDERWLLLPCGLFDSLATYEAAKYSDVRFLGTRFNRIYLLDYLTDGPPKVLRLDVEEWKQSAT
jgi:hypothetical protein